MATETAPRTTAEVARSYFDCVTRRDPEGMAAHWKPGTVDHLHGIVDLPAPDGVRDWFANLFRVIPDLEYEVLDIAADGEKAAVRWRAAGTFDGEGHWEGLAANGARVEMEGCDMLTVRDGLVVDNRAYTNGLEMARQLGVMPDQDSFGERAMLGAANLKTRITGAFKRS